MTCAKSAAALKGVFFAEFVALGHAVHAIGRPAWQGNVERMILTTAGAGCAVVLGNVGSTVAPTLVIVESCHTHARVTCLLPAIGTRCACVVCDIESVVVATIVAALVGSISIFGVHVSVVFCATFATSGIAEANCGIPLRDARAVTRSNLIKLRVVSATKTGRIRLKNVKLVITVCILTITVSTVQTLPTLSIAPPGSIAAVPAAHTIGDSVGGVRASRALNASTGALFGVRCMRTILAILVIVGPVSHSHPPGAYRRRRCDSTRTTAIFDIV